MTDQPRARVPRFGYRGRALTFLGVVWLLIGLDVLRDHGHQPFLAHIPVALHVALWTVTGTIALVTAWWPPRGDRWGFMLLTVPATVRAIAYAYSTLLGVTFGGALGDSRDWIGMLAWVVVVAFVWLLASWPEPVRIEDRA